MVVKKKLIEKMGRKSGREERERERERERKSLGSKMNLEEDMLRIHFEERGNLIGTKEIWENNMKERERGREREKERERERGMETERWKDPRCFHSVHLNNICSLSPASPKNIPSHSNVIPYTNTTYKVAPNSDFHSRAF